MKHPSNKPAVLRELSEGLIVRRTTAADSARLADFNKHIHFTDDTHEPDEGVAAWTRDLLRGNHPTFHPDDFVIVEEEATGKIISATCLIDQTWTYAGIPFGVGRPELVGTLPEYRRRGLVRHIFDFIHQLSDERGHKLQAITGIPWYYRQFGYEMALTLGGGRQGFVPAHIPPLKKGEREPFHIRPAREDDLPFIARLSQEGSRRFLVSEVRDEDIWRYELNGRSRKNVHRYEIRIIERDGEAVGFFTHSSSVFMGQLTVNFYELAPDVPYSSATPSVLRHIKGFGERIASREKKDFNAFYINLGMEHPVYAATPQFMPRPNVPYAWYIRIPDPIGFIRLITPVLDRRLAASPFAGYSGQLTLNFYRAGIRLVFEKGCLARVEPWAPPTANDGDAAFPDLTFLMLLMGFRTSEEIRHIYADALANGEQVRALLNVLFPKQPSRAWGIA